LGGIILKKQDPESGLTIDVPDNVPPLGRFPYSGFWASVYKQVPSALEMRTGFSKFDIAAALSEIEQMANGPYSTIVGEKLWKIGELLALNQYVPATGNGGRAMNYIQDSPDGGRTQIAAICLEPIVNAILQRSSLTGRVGEEIGALESEYNSKLTRMHELAQRMGSMEESYLPLRAVEGARESLITTAIEMDRIDSEINHIMVGLQMVKEHNSELKAITRKMSSAENQHQGVLQQIEMWQVKLRTAENNGNGGAINNAKSRLTELNRANQELSRTIQNLGQKLMKMKVSDNDSNQMKLGLAELQKQRNQLVTTLNDKQIAYGKLEQKYSTNEIEMNMIRQNGSKLSQELEILHEKIMNMKESQKLVVNENESNIVRLWINHLNDVYIDTETFLFGNLRLAQESAMAVQGSSIYQQQAINASKIAEMEKFLSSVDMISDYLDNDEVQLLEQIARLGTAMNYLPGTSRVMALRDMTYSQRKNSYKNMIDEMLELGSPRQAEHTKPAFEAFGFKIGKSEPLSEVADLVQHLTDKILEGK
tara:strand:+ start:877 stop:2487 length:1611 start_codon:yes stop_codon:yes gene_type:complete